MGMGLSEWRRRRHGQGLGETVRKIIIVGMMSNLDEMLAWPPGALPSKEDELFDRLNHLRGAADGLIARGSAFRSLGQNVVHILDILLAWEPGVAGALEAEVLDCLGTMREKLADALVAVEAGAEVMA